MAARSQRHMREVHNQDSQGLKLNINATALPTVAGNAVNGQTLTGTNGTYTGAVPLTITRQWLRNGVPIAGQTTITYLLAPADVGKKIAFQNTVTDSLAKPTTQLFQSAPKGPVT